MREQTRKTRRPFHRNAGPQDERLAFLSGDATTNASDAPKRTCEERVNSRETSRTRYARASVPFCFLPSLLHRVSYLIHTQPDTGEDFSIEKVHLRHRASHALLRMLRKGDRAQNDGEHKGERNGEGKRQKSSPLTHSV